jgi:ribose transport system permease protein
VNGVKIEEQRAAEAAPPQPDLKERLSLATREALQRAWRGENSGVLIIVVIVTIAIFAISLNGTDYLSKDNLLSIVESATPITIMAIATVFVISVGELDLSFASVVPVSAYIAGLLMRDGTPWIVASLAALGFGLAVGFVNGIVTVGFRIPSFVVTLGTMGIVTGFSERINNSQSVSVEDQSFLNVFGQGHVAGISVLIVWTIVMVIIAHLVLAFTPSGRALLATGANVNAARFSGIRTNRMKVGALMASGFAGALAGLLYAGQFGAATYTLGTSDLLTAIAAAIIGGTVLTGGKGSVIGALVGSLLIGILNNGLIIAGLADPEQLMARGVIIIAAVVFSARGASRGAGGTGVLARFLNRRRTPAVASPSAPGSGGAGG